MRKQLAAALLILTLTSTVGSAQGNWCPGHKMSVHQTSFAQQVRAAWTRLFAWL